MNGRNANEANRSGRAMSGWIPGWNSNVRLIGLSDEELQQLALSTGVNFRLLKSQQQAEMASSGSQGDIGEEIAVVPTVEIQLKTNPKNPRKARKQNIKMLRKALRPPRYNLGLYKIYRYNGGTECACCGVDVRRFVEGDNAYTHIVDDDTGLSLADLYWLNEDGTTTKPHARTHGDHGDEMNSTLCPAHLHIFHTLKQIKAEEELESDGFSRPVSMGTKFLRVPFTSNKTQNRSSTESLIKYEPFFKMIHEDVRHEKGITVTQHTNPISGVADLVPVTFYLRGLQLQDALKQNGLMGIPNQPQQQQTNVPSPNPITEQGAT